MFEQQWYALPDSGLSGSEVSIWWDIRNMREPVNKKLEEQRAAGAIGSAWQPKWMLYAPAKDI